MPTFRGLLDLEIRDRIDQLLGLEKIAINPVVWSELYQGVKNKREEKELADFITLSRNFNFDDLCWKTTAEIGRQCVQKGITVPFSDLMIQASAIRYEADLLHLDKHFDLIQKALK